MTIKEGRKNRQDLHVFDYAHEITFVGSVIGIYQYDYFSSNVKIIWGIATVTMFAFYVKKYLPQKNSRASLILELLSMLSVAIGIMLTLFVQNEDNIFGPYFWLFMFGILIKKGKPLNSLILNKTILDRNSIILYAVMLILSIYASIKAFLG